jgi:hypothetical protein
MICDGFDYADRALALDSGSAWAWGRSGWIQGLRWRGRRAIECFQMARALAPVDLTFFAPSVSRPDIFGRLATLRSVRWFERALAGSLRSGSTTT